jgi:hypothetical protein
MTTEGRRCTIGLGTPSRPSWLKIVTERIENAPLRQAIESYLSKTGILLDRTSPTGWFTWLASSSDRFAARCAEPPTGNFTDDGYQPWNYYVLAEIVKRKGKVWTAEVISPMLMHDTDPRLTALLS